MDVVSEKMAAAFLSSGHVVPVDGGRFQTPVESIEHEEFRNKFRALDACAVEIVDKLLFPDDADNSPGVGAGKKSLLLYTAPHETESDAISSQAPHRDFNPLLKLGRNAYFAINSCFNEGTELYLVPGSSNFTNDEQSLKTVRPVKVAVPLSHLLVCHPQVIHWGGPSLAGTRGNCRGHTTRWLKNLPKDSHSSHVFPVPLEYFVPDSPPI